MTSEGRRVSQSVMAADITLLFKASVKTVKTRNKALGLIDTTARDEPSSARRKTRQRNTFSCKSKEVVRLLSLYRFTSANQRMFHVLMTTNKTLSEHLYSICLNTMICVVCLRSTIFENTVFYIIFPQIDY